MSNGELLTVIQRASTISLVYFENILKEKLGDDFPRIIGPCIDVDKYCVDEVTFDHVLQEIKGDVYSWTSEYIFNVLKKKVKVLANKVLKDLKACQPAKITFCKAIDSCPFAYDIPINTDTGVTFRVTFGMKFAHNKRYFEVAVYYLIQPTGENQNG